MVVDYETFVAAFPEFADAATYTQIQFDLWEAEAERELSADRFGGSLPLAVMLFAAHNMALSAKAAKAAATGGIAGGSLAAVSSKSVGSVSVSYDTSDSSIDGAGEWNATGYGQRLYRMLKSFNTGPFYIAHPRPLPRPGQGYGFGRRF
jgi:hypothetical protein